MFEHKRTDTITIDLSKMANAKNNFDKTLPHPYGTTVILKSESGREVVVIPMGTVVSLISLFSVLEDTDNPGPTLDKLYKLLREERGENAVTIALNQLK